MGRSKGFAAGVSAEYLRKVGVERPRRPRPAPQPAAQVHPPNTLILAAALPESVSVNHAYVTGKDGRRHASPELQAFKVAARQALSGVQPAATPREQPMRLSLTFYGRWLCQDGTPRKKDASNLCKLAEDVLAEFLGVDDRWFFVLDLEKVHDPDRPRTEVVILTL